MHKVSQVAALAEECRPELAVEVDGGMHAATVGEAATAGGTVVVAGSAVFDAFRPVAVCLVTMRTAARHACQAGATAHSR